MIGDHQRLDQNVNDLTSIVEKREIEYIVNNERNVSINPNIKFMDQCCHLGTGHEIEYKEHVKKTSTFYV